GPARQHHRDAWQRCNLYHAHRRLGGRGTLPAGDDQISYTLTGNLVSVRTVLVYLGSGKDQFVANVNGAVDNPAGLDIEAYGGTGASTMTINQSGQIKQGTFIPYLAAGSGRDVMTYNGTGPINGGAAINPAFSAGGGNDTIVSNYSG